MTTARSPCPPRRATSRRPETSFSTSRCWPCSSASPWDRGTAGTATASSWRAGSGSATRCQQYDEYGLGARVGAGDLPPFCVTLNDFRAEYLDNGQPVQYTADVSYVEVSNGGGTGRGGWRSTIRCGWTAANVYLLGHGYAPVLRYTDRYGVTQTSVAPFLPDDGMLTSSGVATFPDANVDPDGPGRANARPRSPSPGSTCRRCPHDPVRGTARPFPPSAIRR